MIDFMSHLLYSRETLRESGSNYLESIKAFAELVEFMTRIGKPITSSQYSLAERGNRWIISKRFAPTAMYIRPEINSRTTEV